MVTPEGNIKFVQNDPFGGEQEMELESDLFMVLVSQAKSLEEFRCLWFGLSKRTLTANAKLKRVAKAAACSSGD